MKKAREGIEKWIQQLQLAPKEKNIILVLAIGTVVLTTLLLITDNQPLEGSLLRNTYGEGDRDEQLYVKIEETQTESEGSEGKVVVDIQISQQTYTEEELQQVLEDAIEELEVLVLGENTSADEVYSDLNLVSETSNEAIEVEWSWSPYEVLSVDGEIQAEYVEEEGTLVAVTGILTCQEKEVQYIQNYLILPEAKEGVELVVDQIAEAVIAADAESITASELSLPQNVGGYTLVWYAPFSYRGFGIFLMGIGAIAVLLWRKKADKIRENQDRSAQMLNDYTQIVHTFALYIGAGMTVKNAWKRMVQEYDNKEGKSGRTVRYAYEEMKRAFHEMSNGISETECYEQFGRRCNMRCYQRLGLLLSQNVRKGTKGLTLILERETLEAFEDRKNRAKQEGEKAGTKLLMPMFLMLVVVLVIVITPAFFSIQI